jgi:hypothetical protein
MLRKVAPVSAALLLALAVVVAAGQQALEVTDIVITDQVMDREPGEHMTAVPSSVGKVYCWMRVTGAEGETIIEHVWYKGDVEMARVPLTVAGSNWRTWSSKNIEEIWTGDWRVDVVGPDGEVLRSVSFTVG